MLAVSNVLNNGVLPARLYVPWNLGIAVVIAVVAAASGLRLGDIGVARRSWRRSVRFGLIGAGAVALVYAVALLLPLGRSAFDDGRVGSSVSGLLYHVLIQIPLGTVLLEELAFRGVLPAALGWRDNGRWQWWPAIGASGLFALWHVLPAARVLDQNAAYHDAFGGVPILASFAAVLAMLLAGLALCWARHVGRGLATPVLLHLSTNCLGFLVAWLVAR